MRAPGGTIRRRLLFGVLASGYGKLVVAGIQLLLVPILTLKWGLPLYGQWLLLSSVPVFLGASDFGFSTAAGIRIIGEVARGEQAEALLTYRSARAMVTRLTLVALVVLAAAAVLLPAARLEVAGGMPAHEARLVLVLLGGYALVWMQSALFLAVARAMQRTALATAIDATTQLCEGLAVAVIAMTGGRPVAAALAYLIVKAFGLITTIAYARAVAPWLRRGGSSRATRERTRALWRPALAAMVLPLSLAGYLQGSAIAVGAAAGAAAVPIYTSLRTLSRTGLQLLSVLFLPLMPEYTAAHARGDTHRTAVIAGGLVMASVVIGIAYAALIGLFGTSLLALWTNGVIRPPPAMVLVTAAGVLMSVVWNPLAALLLAISRHETYSYVFVPLALLSVTLCYVLVGSMGLTGAAAANLVVEAGMLLTVLQSLRQHGGRLALGRGTIVAALPGRWRAGLRRAKD